MKKREFLLPLATLAAAVSAEQATATVVTPSQELSEVDDLVTATGVSQQSEEMVTGRSGNNLFGFILKRTEDGKILAYHSSHSSHASHGSHSSHYSSR